MKEKNMSFMLPIRKFENIRKEKNQSCNVYIFPVNDASHQWRSGILLKAGRWEVPGSNPGRACRPSRLEFSVVPWFWSFPWLNTG